MQVNFLKADFLKAGCQAVLLLMLPLLGQAATQIDQQRELFQQARAQLAQGDISTIKPRLPELYTYPLFPWLEYESLLRNFESTPDDALLAFTRRYPNSLMSDTLYARWAKRLADTRDWTAILDYIPDNPEQMTTQCFRAEATVLVGSTAAGLARGKAIWDHADKDLPSACDGIIRQLQKRGLLQNADHWQRIRGLIETNHVSAAKSVAANLPVADAELVDLWIEMRKAPEKTLPRAFDGIESERLREIMVFGLKRAADNKLTTALPLWDQAQATFTFTPAEKGAVESKFGMWEAWRHDLAGFKRLQAIPAAYRSTEGNIWLARIAMRTGQWDSVLDAVTGLQGDEDEGERDIWQYWKARALEQTGKKAEAHSLYRVLAQDTTFYGFMAADRLGQRYAHLDEPPPDRSQRIAGLNKVAAIQRWQEWNALGERSQARKEWFRALQDMDKDGILAAAELATQQNDANLAIWTVSRTQDWNIVDLRFPLLYEDLVMKQSRDQGIRPEWILGIMRRESAFDAAAESGAKALGLMQLMPATARDVGRQLGMQVTDKDDILQPATNVQLGSAYLRSMLGRFAGNYAQATAAYNAGPGRIPKWAPDQTLEADQWVESIPYNETRRYVRAVMAYTTIYDHKLNQDRSTRLSVRLKPIKPE